MGKTSSEPFAFCSTIRGSRFRGWGLLMCQENPGMGQARDRAPGALLSSRLGLCQLAGHRTSLCLWNTGPRKLVMPRPCGRHPAQPRVGASEHAAIYPGLRHAPDCKVPRHDLLHALHTPRQKLRPGHRRGLATARGGAGLAPSPRLPGQRPFWCLCMWGPDLPSPSIPGFAHDTRTMLMWATEGHMGGQRRERGDFQA